jgi:hypothetical protein
MNPISEELRDALDDCTLNFGPDDWDELRVMGPDSEALMSFELSTIVDGLLDSMGTSRERDDMLGLARHFDHLAKQIRRAIDDIEKGGE